MEWINEKAKTLKQGAIRAMFDRANTMTGVISLGIGEPDMPTPKLVCEACKEALDKGITHYTPNAGTLSFRQAIAEKSYLKDLHYDPNTEIIITNGGMGALSLLFLILLNKGDEILIQDPQWLNSRRVRSTTVSLTRRPAATFWHSRRMASAQRKPSGRAMRRLAESSSVRSSHGAEAVIGAFMASAMRQRLREQMRSQRMGLRL